MSYPVIRAETVHNLQALASANGYVSVAKAAELTGTTTQNMKHRLLRLLELNAMERRSFTTPKRGNSVRGGISRGFEYKVTPHGLKLLEQYNAPKAPRVKPAPRVTRLPANSVFDLANHI